MIISGAMVKGPHAKSYITLCSDCLMRLIESAGGWKNIDQSRISQLEGFGTALCDLCHDVITRSNECQSLSID